MKNFTKWFLIASVTMLVPAFLAVIFIENEVLRVLINLPTITVSVFFFVISAKEVIFEIMGEINE